MEVQLDDIVEGDQKFEMESWVVNRVLRMGRQAEKEEADLE